MALLANVQVLSIDGFNRLALYVIVDKSRIENIRIELKIAVASQTFDNRPFTENAGILIDALHFDRSGSSLEDLKKLPREWFHFFHLCDAEKELPKTKEGLIHTARSARMFPGEGGINLRAILDCIPIVPYSLEIPNESLIKELGPEEYARRAISAAKKYIEG